MDAFFCGGLKHLTIGKEISVSLLCRNNIGIKESIPLAFNNKYVGKNENGMESSVLFKDQVGFFFFCSSIQ